MMDDAGVFFSLFCSKLKRLRVLYLDVSGGFKRGLGFRRTS